MKSAHEDFAAFGDDVWLNCAHQGPLPLVAAQAAECAIEWKKLPYELTAERFSETPALLRLLTGASLNWFSHSEQLFSRQATF